MSIRAGKVREFLKLFHCVSPVDGEKEDLWKANDVLYTMVTLHPILYI